MKPTRRICRAQLCGVLACLTTLLPLPAATQQADQDLLMSLDSLLNLPVSAASRYSQLARESAASTSIVTSEEIEAFGYESLADVLSQVPGFYRTYDRNYTYVGVRGFGRPGEYNNRILLTIDGHPVNSNFYNSALLGTAFALDLDWIERVEVARGPGSALYGSNAIAAVVNLVPKQGAELESFLVTGTTGDLGLNSGSVRYGTRIGESGDLSLFANVRRQDGGDLYFPEFDDPSTNNGIAQQMDWEEAAGFFGRLNLGEFTVSALASSRDKGIPTAPWDLIFNDDRAKTNDEMYFLDVKWDRVLTPTQRLSVSARHDRYGYTGGYPYEAPSGVFSETNVDVWSGADARLIWDVTTGNRLILGTEYVRSQSAEYTAGDEVDTYFEGNFPYHVISIYAQNELQIRPNLALVGGLRFDRFAPIETGSTINRTAEGATNRPTPRVGVVYHPRSSSTLKLLFGEAFRVPSRYELHYDDGSSTLSNPGLGPERIRTLELAWEQEFGAHVWWGLSAFDNKMEDLIDETVNEDGLFQYQNGGNARVRGVEGQLRFQQGSFSGFTSLALQSGKIEEPTGGSLTNSPGNLLRVGLIYSDSRGVRFAWNTARDGSRRTPQDNRSWGYTISNIDVSTTHLLAPFRVSVGLKNLFDTRYTLPGGFEHAQSRIAQDGRVARISLSVAF